MAKKKSGEKGAAILTVDLGDRGGKHSFRSIEGVRDWLAAEQEAWRWIQDLTAKRGRRPSLAMHLWEKISPQFSRIDSEIGTAPSDPKDETRLASIERVIHSAYINEGLIHSSSRMAKVVFAEREVGDGAGLGALSYYMHEYMDEPQDVADSTVFRGRLSAVLAELGLYGTAEAARKALDDLHAEIWRQFDDYKTEQDGLLTASRDFNDTLEDQIASQDQTQMDRLRAHSQDFSDLVENSKKQLQEITDTYDAQLALQAPVRYWKNKLNAHVRLIRWFGWSFGVGLVLAAVGLSVGLTLILSDDTLKPGQIGIALVLVTMVVWGLSMLARNLLSNIHLATDANERRVMVHTYLSLMRRGKGLKDDEIKLILEVLFRTAATGIVKEDARPPSIAEYLIGKVKF